MLEKRLKMVKEAVRRNLINEAKALEMIDFIEAEACRDDLYLYLKYAWPILEPDCQFIDGWHIGCIAEYLTAVRDGQIQNLIINMPPRHLKSTLVTIAFPTWIWTSRPEWRFMFASYAQTLATKHSLDRRRVMSSDWYQHHYSGVFQIEKDQDQKMEMENNRRGVMIATSVGGSATGKGGNVLICDDPLNPEMAISDTERKKTNNWYDLTFSTRLNDKKTGIKIVVMQRLHEKDLTGHLLEKGGWEHLKIQGHALKRTVYLMPISGKEIVREAGSYISEEREGEIEHKKMKIALGSDGYASQYQQEPAPDTGIIFKRYWFRFWYIGDEPEPVIVHDENGKQIVCVQKKLPPDLVAKIQSWDLSFDGKTTSDYVAGGAYAPLGADHFFIDQVRKKMDFVATCESFVDFSAKHPKAYKKLLEKKANGDALLSSLGSKIGGIVPITPQGDKEQRAKACTPEIEAGNFWCPHPKQFPWVVDYITEMCTFPKAANDDQVDQTTQYLNYMRKNNRGLFFGLSGQKSKGEDEQ